MARPYNFRDRSVLFSCEIVAFCRVLVKRDEILRRLAFQLLDAGTSIGANLAESGDGQSKKDFIAKSFISLKEARETVYWLRVIRGSEPPLAATAATLGQEASEFVAMLVSSIKKARSNPDRGDSIP
jgi:four helix bundle protein